MSFLPCELHCHTCHSDGKFTVKELQSAAKDNALSLIALTDHNTFSGCSELDCSVIPSVLGIEWTTYFGHILVLGAKGFVDWRSALPDNIDGKLDEVKQNGGVIGIAHPFQLGSPFCTGGRFEFNIRKWENVDYIEIFHENFSKDNCENIKALEFWSRLLDKGYHIAASYGRDWHSNERKGYFGCTYIDFDEAPTAEKALESIRNGRTVASLGMKLFFEVIKDSKRYKLGETVPSGECDVNLFCDVYARHQDFKSISYDEIRIVTNGSTCVYKANRNETKISLTLNPNSWYRAELWGTMDGCVMPLAVTSPIYTGSIENEHAM